MGDHILVALGIMLLRMFGLGRRTARSVMVSAMCCIRGMLVGFAFFFPPAEVTGSGGTQNIVGEDAMARRSLSRSQAGVFVLLCGCCFKNSFSLL
jgi:hypothetical protein